MNWTLNRVGNNGLFTRLMLKEIDRVTSVVPQQMVSPRSRLTCRVHVAATEEVRLHVHLLDGQLTGFDAVVDPLVAGIEPPHVTRHRDDTGLSLDFDNSLRIGDGV